MKQSKAREIISSLASLYSLQDFEEETIITILEPKELVDSDDYPCVNCPSCGKGLHYLRANFCWNCGQPIECDD